MIAVYAGRFDPVTNGHLDILRRASRIFERVTVVVYDAPSDETLFPTSQRVSMLRTWVEDMPSVASNRSTDCSPTSSGIEARMPSCEACGR